MAAKGKTEQLHLAGRPCACFVPQGEVRRAAVLCGWHMEELLPALAEEAPHTVLFFAQADGGRDFTPWPAEAVWEGEPFHGKATAYLEFLQQSVLPFLAARFGICKKEERMIAGYSLGGLFSLWAACETNLFSQAASLSGSLWYPDFMKYIEKHLPKAEHIYLSLGDREPFGGPPPLRAVGKCTEAVYALLQQANYDVTFEWNRGGHAKGIENRWRKALRCLAQYGREQK